MSTIFSADNAIQRMRREPHDGEEMLVTLGDGLGTSLGNLYADLPAEAGDPASQYLWARAIDSNVPFRIIGGGMVSIAPNINVWVEWRAKYGLWKLKEADLSHYIAINRSVHFENPNDAHNQHHRLEQLIPLKSFPIGGLKVAVAGVRFTDKQGRNVDWKGTSDIAGSVSPHVDFTSHRPATSDHHCYALVYFDVEEYHADNNPIGVVVSTSQTGALDRTDIQECLDQLNALGVEYLESHAYRLDNGMTDIKARVSSHQDRRNWLTGIGGSVAASTITGILSLAHGGTGADLSATGGANQFVRQSTSGGAFTVSSLASADLTTALTTPPAIGGTTPSTGAFTTLSSSIEDAATNTVTDLVTLTHNSTGTPAASFGTGLLLRGESSTTTNQNMARIRTAWTTATHASRASNLTLSVWNVGTETDVLTLTPTGASVAGTGDTTGDMRVGSAGAALGAARLVVNQAASGKGQIIRANATTPGNLIEIQDSAGTAQLTLQSSYQWLWNNLGFLRGTNGLYLRTTSTAPITILDGSTGNLNAVEGGGSLNVGSSATPLGRVSIYALASSKGLVVRQNATPGSANIQEWQNSTGTALALIDSTGAGRFAGAQSIISDAATNALTNVVTVGHNSTGTAAAGFGPAVLFQGESSTTDNQAMARIKVPWVTATHASRVSKMTVSVYNVSTETDVADFTTTGIESALDMKITDSAKGLILKDRTDASLWRLVVTSGVLSIESA